MSSVSVQPSFVELIESQTLKQVTHAHTRLAAALDVAPAGLDSSFDFFVTLRSRLLSTPTRATAERADGRWRIASLLTRLTSRSERREYVSPNGTRPMRRRRVLVVGGGVSGLRCAIELALLGARVVVVEKRNQFSRNNVIHLWPSVIKDLIGLGAKRFYARFCIGSIDHISIRCLQLILLKIALLFGVDFVDSVNFDQLCPTVIQMSCAQTLSCSPDTCLCCCHAHGLADGSGARAHFSSNDPNRAEQVSRVSQYSYDVIIGADGRRNTLSSDFPRKEFRGKLAIAITANFVNRRTEAEARVSEISGVSYIYAQKWFQELFADTGVQLENICFYRDETLYFVMTATKASLLAKRVLIADRADTRSLLADDNICRAALLAFAREAAQWSTGLAELTFATNSKGGADLALFDFTSVYAAANASRAKRVSATCLRCAPTAAAAERKSHALLMLCGDSLLEPFWPTGSGAGRGFLAALDSAWTAGQWATMDGSAERMLDVIAERESIYRLLAQTTPQSINCDACLNPAKRYKEWNRHSVIEIRRQIAHLIDGYASVPQPTAALPLQKSMSASSVLNQRRLRRATVGVTASDLNARAGGQQSIPFAIVDNNRQSVVNRYKHDWLLGSEAADTRHTADDAGDRKPYEPSERFRSRLEDLRAKVGPYERSRDAEVGQQRPKKSREITERAHELDARILAEQRKRFEPTLLPAAKLDVNVDSIYKKWKTNEAYVSSTTPALQSIQDVKHSPTAAAIHASRVQQLERNMSARADTANNNCAVEVTRDWIASISEELQHRMSANNNATAPPPPKTTPVRALPKQPTPPTRPPPAVPPLESLNARPPAVLCARCSAPVPNASDRVSFGGRIVHRSCLRCWSCGVQLDRRSVISLESVTVCDACRAARDREEQRRRRLTSTIDTMLAFVNNTEHVDLRERLEYELDANDGDVNDNDERLSSPPIDNSNDDDDSDNWTTTSSSSSEPSSDDNQSEAHDDNDDAKNANESNAALQAMSMSTSSGGYSGRFYDKLCVNDSLFRSKSIHSLISARPLLNTRSLDRHSPATPSGGQSGGRADAEAESTLPFVDQSDDDFQYSRLTAKKAPIFEFNNI